MLTYFQKGRIMIKLYVPFSEKDEAKALGAIWNPEEKFWFISEETDKTKFEKWLLKTDEEILATLKPGLEKVEVDQFYIVEAEKFCPKCQNTTPVYAILLEKGTLMAHETDPPSNLSDNEYYDWEESDDSWEIQETSQALFLAPLSHTDVETRKIIESKTSIYQDFSKFAQATYYANHCLHCGALQGTHHVYEDYGAPFNPADWEEYKKMKYTLIKHKATFSLDAKGETRHMFINEYLYEPLTTAVEELRNKEKETPENKSRFQTMIRKIFSF